MITSHLIYVIKQFFSLFYDKNIIFDEKKNSNRETLVKHVT